MQEKAKRLDIRKVIEWSIIAVFFGVSVLLQYLPIEYTNDAFINAKLAKILPQTCGAVASVLLLIRLKLRLFGKIENWIYILPCLLVAVNNFQFSAFFQGKMQLAHKDAIAFILFALDCLSVGLLEECVFRGVLFALLLQYLPKNKKGFLCVYFLSSVIFGLAHLLNGVGALLQVGYSVLTGGLFAFCLIKTKNILCPALIHAVYNFCGMLYDTQGLGNGVVFDVGTIWSMAIIGVLVGVFVLYKTVTYTEEECVRLYGKFLISQ